MIRLKEREFSGASFYPPDVELVREWAEELEEAMLESNRRWFSEIYDTRKDETWLTPEAGSRD